jgi:hypothetical protein
MSPTLLEATIAVIAAVLVFLFALRAVPLAIELLADYFDRSLSPDNEAYEEPIDEHQS